MVVVWPTGVSYSMEEIRMTMAALFFVRGEERHPHIPEETCKRHIDENLGAWLRELLKSFSNFEDAR